MRGGRGLKTYTASEEAILRGEVTDVYFPRARRILEEFESAGRAVVAEAHAYSLPPGYKWAVFAGLEEVCYLLEGKGVDVDAMSEGELFRAMEPLIRISGPYAQFGVYESSILGILRHESSVATKAARLRIASWGKTLIFFGIRCVHPAIAPAIDRAAFIGGCDAVSGVVGASMIGEKPVGTMPHALIVVIGDQARAWKLFDEVMPPEVPRIALCDTWSDERAEALLASQTLGERLHGVRLDTPSSRRGNMRKIVEETRWTLDINGWRSTKIYVSGGLDEGELEQLRDVVDGFGVGTSIAFPPSIDISMDIVEVEGRPVSKKGKLPGAKQVYRCSKLHDALVPANKKIERCPRCGEGVEPLLKPLIRNGEVVADIPSARDIRERVLARLEVVRSMESLDPSPMLLS